jgi:hypothetical protein
MSSKKDIELLNRGILPDGLNFSLKKNQVIDWEKVRYNTYYQSPEFWQNKLTSLENIPGYDKLIEKMAEKSLSPLDEMILRQTSFDENNIFFSI